jgi:uncharacterized SAM-binding protein YcdF (DUF218 family)
MKDRAASDAQSEMYRPPTSAATNTRVGRNGFIMRAATGTAIGVFGALAIAMLGIGEIFGSSGYDMIGPLAIAGAILGVTKLRSILLWLAVAATGIILLIASTSIIVRPAQSLVRRDVLPASADAIVVLSAGITTDGTIHPQGTDRLLKGLELLSRGVAPALVVSREDRQFNGTDVTSQADQERIISLSPSAVRKIVFAGTTRTTREEAVRVRDISRRTGWRRVVVVTSPLHSRRACAVFERVGFIVSCAPADSRDVAVGRLITPVDRLRAFQLWIYETAGTIRYRQRGWL